MPFDPMLDTIAITIPRFTLRKHADAIMTTYNEPYLVSLCVDESGSAIPAIDCSVMPFPKVKAGTTVQMLGDGHLLYGPRNPGSFVALSVLVMESDDDLRATGAALQEIVHHQAVSLGLQAILAANPGSAAVLGILKELTQLVAGRLKNNKDDELFRIEGTFLRDHAVPYHVNRTYTGLGNDFVDLSLNILPLQAPNGQGPQPERMVLTS